MNSEENKQPNEETLSSSTDLEFNSSEVADHRSAFLLQLDSRLKVDPFFAMPEQAHKLMMSVLTRLFNEKDEKGNVIKKRILGKFLDATFVSYLKLPLEAYVGRRMTGDMSLNEIERVCYLLSGITGLLSWALGAESVSSWDLDGMELAGALYAGSWLSYIVGIQREIDDTIDRIHSQIENKHLLEFLELMNEFINEEITYARR